MLFVVVAVVVVVVVVVVVAVAAVDAVGEKKFSHSIYTTPGPPP